MTGVVATLSTTSTGRSPSQMYSGCVAPAGARFGVAPRFDLPKRGKGDVGADVAHGQTRLVPRAWADAEHGADGGGCGEKIAPRCDAAAGLGG